MNIVSFNVNGISNERKRKIIFKKILDLKCIAFLQETHSFETNENKWKNEWPGNIMFSHGESNSKGVCILIPPDIDYDVQDKITDNEGRLLILKIKINNSIYILCNIYAPTRDNKLAQNNFITFLKNTINQFDNENIIIGGDFNLYLNPKLDKLDSMSNKSDNPVYRSEVLSMLDSLDLNDAWRSLYPQTRRYTWHSRGRSSRLDNFFISDHLLNNLTQYKIQPGLHSDHSILNMTFCNENSSKGRGYWKFNSKLLHYTVYINNIKKLLEETKKELIHYSDKGLIWEITKLLHPLLYTKKEKKK